MKRIALILILATTPAAAEQGDVDEGVGLLSRGAEMLLRGLLDEVEPALRELREQIRSLDGYHPPEMLPNGDIIIRRKAPQAPSEIVPDPEQGIDI